MKYACATETRAGLCLPPEAYIHLWRSACQDQKPKFKSSIFPKKDSRSEVHSMSAKNKGR